ncbi:unnamed protein product [Schistosoma guineensis]|nr:unnamed protein product [Schistosoma guineensis]
MTQVVLNDDKSPAPYSSHRIYIFPSILFNITWLVDINNKSNRAVMKRKGVIFDVEILILDTWTNLYTLLFDKTLRNEPIPRPLDWDELEKINDVESGMAYFRQNEKLLQTTINNIIQNESKRLKAIQKYMRCKNKQQHEESFSLFLKEMNKQFENENLMSFPDYSTLKGCFIKQEKILERQKSNNKNKVCELPETFYEQDIQDLNQLISKKYDILWRWNKALFNYEFASKNYRHTLSLLQRTYNEL